MNNAIGALKKAHQAQAITKDTFTLEKFVIKFEVDNVAVMDIVAVESKYIAKFDKRHLVNVDGAGSLGMRTRFYLKDGTTVGSFSNGAFRFFSFLADLCGYKNAEDMTFLHLDISGNLKIGVTVLELDSLRSTYNFDVIEEGSEFLGMSDYFPTVQNVLALASGVNPSTGEIIPEEKAPEETEQPEEKTEEKPPVTKSKKA